MKLHLKYFFTLIVTVNLISNTGLPVFYHYCCGELESVTPLFKANGCCGEENEDDSDCCKNETKIIIQKAENNLADFQVRLTPFITDLTFFCTYTDNDSHCFPMAIFQKISSVNFHPPDTGRNILCSKSVLII